jgi:hypothetical protein
MSTALGHLRALRLPEFRTQAGAFRIEFPHMSPADSDGFKIARLDSSLRGAKRRSNPERLAQLALDCFAISRRRRP